MQRFVAEVESGLLAAAHGLGPSILDFGWMSVDGSPALFLLMERHGSSLATVAPPYLTRGVKRSLTTLLQRSRALGIPTADLSHANITSLDSGLKETLWNWFDAGFY